jgi:phosphate transport system permease protein
VLVVSSVALVALLAGIGWSLWRDSAGARAAFGWRFLLTTSSATWNPAADQFQAWPFVYGTLVTSIIAVALAVPVGVLAAVFLAEISPARLSGPLGALVEFLAAIPSVVYGLWGMFVFLPVVVAPLGELLASTLGKVPILSGLFAGPIPASGVSRLGAGLVLMIMILPTIAAVSRDVLRAIPRAQREAALALGATRWETIWRVLLPYGRSGILGAVLLGLGRAMGETMAVTMVIGNSIQGSASVLRPGYSMASVIANEFAEAVSAMHSSALQEIGLVLFAMTLALNLLARLLVWSVGRRNAGEART